MWRIPVAFGVAFVLGVFGIAALPMLVAAGLLAAIAGSGVER